MYPTLLLRTRLCSVVLEFKDVNVLESITTTVERVAADAG